MSLQMVISAKPKNTINYPIPFSFDICLILVWTRFQCTVLLSLLSFNQFGIHIKVENLWLENLWQWTCHINLLPFLLVIVNKGVSSNQQIYWQHLLLGKIAQLILKSKLWNSFAFHHLAQHKYAHTYTHKMLCAPKASFSALPTIYRQREIMQISPL